MMPESVPLVKLSAVTSTIVTDVQRVFLSFSMQLSGHWLETGQHHFLTHPAIRRHLFWTIAVSLNKQYINMSMYTWRSTKNKLRGL